MEVFSLQTASLADLWAAYGFIESEIKELEEIVNPPCEGCKACTFEDDVRRFNDAKWAKKRIRMEIARRVDYSEPIIKA